MKQSAVKPVRLFPYSGGKARLVPYLPAPAPGTDTIVEPFAGSAAYALSYAPKFVILTDINPLVRELWEWLIDEATEDDLLGLRQKLEHLRQKGAKVDLRTKNLPSPLLTLARLMVASVVKGQLSSWTLYPQHRSSVDVLVGQLPYIKKSVFVVEPGNGGYEDAFADAFMLQTSVHRKGRTCVFVDPPYIGTKANYKDGPQSWTLAEAKKLADLVHKAAQAGCQVVMTYGDGAQQVFPEFDWQVAVQRKVPNIRRGGTVDRTEWFCELGR